jgi:tyrosyl-tRNA synthetase
LVDALVRTGLASSRGQARQLLAQGGVSVNNRRTTGEEDLVAGDALHERWILLRRGRANQAVLLVEP